MISATSNTTCAEIHYSAFQPPTRQAILSTIVGVINTSPDLKTWHDQSWRDCGDLTGTRVKDLIDNLLAGVATVYTREDTERTFEGPLNFIRFVEKHSCDRDDI